MIGGKFTEIPFILRYDRKKGNSKMIGSITTLGYFLMVILNYWPWGGWRAQRKAKNINKNNYIIAKNKYKVCEMIIDLNESYQSLVKKKKAA